jgi:hypothetical protein
MPRLKLEAELGLNKTGFDAGMAAAGKQVQQFGQFVAGAFSIGAVFSFAKSLVDLGSEVKDASDRLGVGAKDIQEFQLAAKLGGQDIGVFARALEKIRVAMVKGVGGEGNPLAQFGITMEDLRSGDAVGILRKLADGLDEFSGSADQTKALMDVFGAKGTGGVINMLRELKNTGGIQIISDKQADMLDEFSDKLTTLWHNVKVIFANAAMGGVYNLRTGQWENLPEGGSRPASPRTEGIEAQVLAQQMAQQELAKTKNETDKIEEKNRVAQLTDAERLNELLAQRADLYRQLQFALDEQTEANIKNKIAQTDSDLIQVQGKIRPRMNHHIDESPLGRIGAFSGAGGSQNSAQMQGLITLRRIETALVQKGIIVRDSR